MTDITEYRCENCGSTHLKEEKDFIICQACGSKFKDNSKKNETPPVITIEPPRENTNINTNTQNNKDTDDIICCCKGVGYFSLVAIIYALTLKAIGALPALILGIIVTIIVAIIIHKLTNKK